MIYKGSVISGKKMIQYQKIKQCKKRIATMDSFATLEEK